MCCRFAILGGSDEIAEIAVLGNSRVRQQLIRLLLRMAAVRSCVAAMMSSVAGSAGLRRAFRRSVSLVAAACLSMGGTLAHFQG